MSLEPQESTKDLAAWTQGPCDWRPLLAPALSKNPDGRKLLDAMDRCANVGRGGRMTRYEKRNARLLRCGSPFCAVCAKERLEALSAEAKTLGENVRPAILVHAVMAGMPRMETTVACMGPEKQHTLWIYHPAFDPEQTARAIRAAEDAARNAANALAERGAGAMVGRTTLEVMTRSQLLAAPDLKGVCEGLLGYEITEQEGADAPGPEDGLILPAEETHYAVIHDNVLLDLGDLGEDGAQAVLADAFPGQGRIRLFAFEDGPEARERWLARACMAPLSYPGGGPIQADVLCDAAIALSRSAEKVS